MMEDNQQEIAKKMRELLSEARKSRIAPSQSAEPTVVDSTVDDSWLPKLQDGEFLLRIRFEQSNYICCMREPTWLEAAGIELYAYRKSADGREYFAGEYERRELLKKSLRWIAEVDTKSIIESELSRLSYDFVERLWEQAAKVFFVQFDEAQALYASAKAFFAGELGHPVHPVILEVDGIIKHMFVFNATEWRNVGMSNYERYQIVWMAYSEPESQVPEPNDVSENSPASDPRLRALLGRMNKR